MVIGQRYVYHRPLVAQPVHAAQHWEGRLVILRFGLKVFFASKLFFLIFTSIALPLPLPWMLALHPALLLVMALWQNPALCASAAMQHPRAQGWMQGAARLLRLATAAGAPGVEVTPGAECRAVLQHLQFVVGFALPLWVVLWGESRRFAELAGTQRGACSAWWAQLYLVVHQFGSAPQHAAARRGVVAVVFCASWILTSCIYSR